VARRGAASLARRRVCARSSSVWWSMSLLRLHVGRYGARESGHWAERTVLSVRRACFVAQSPLVVAPARLRSGRACRLQHCTLLGVCLGVHGRR
jgi:hypothetical protein